MTPTARTGARSCTAVLGLAGLGVVLLGAPAFALDLPSGGSWRLVCTRGGSALVATAWVLLS